MRPYHLLSKATDRIDMKFYVDLCNVDVQRTKQDGVSGVIRFE